MNNEWQFADTNDYAYIEVDAGTGAINKITDWSWRWEVHYKYILDIDKYGWYGIVSSADEAIEEVEKRLK